MGFMVDWCSISIQAFFCELSQSAEVKKKFFLNPDSLAAKVLDVVRLGQSNTLVQDLEGRSEMEAVFLLRLFICEKPRHGGIPPPQPSPCPEAALTQLA